MKQQITADESRRARRTLGVTQAKLAEETGLNTTLIKHFETYRIDNPPQDFQTTLINYYSEKGLDVSTLMAPNSEQKKVGHNIVENIAIPRMSFLVSDKLTHDEIEELLVRMEANDDRICELLQKGITKGFFGGYSDETITENRELFGAMAENHLLFRCLQGRNLFDGFDPKSEDETHLHLVHEQFSKSPMAQNVLPEIKSDKTDLETTDQE